MRPSGMHRQAHMYMIDWCRHASTGADQ